MTISSPNNPRYTFQVMEAQGRDRITVELMLLEQGRWSEIDVINLIEEMRDLGNRHRDALESHLTWLLMHLLKWQYQSDAKSGSWLRTTKEARKQIARLVRKHPVLALHTQKVGL